MQAETRSYAVPSFPRMQDLPPVVDTNGWRWEQYRTPSFPSYNFWRGFDQDGTRWLTKLRGDFYAYREIVFARLAQKMGWSCQSSVFMKLDVKSGKELGVPAGVHAAHWFLEEHPSVACGPECPKEGLRGRQIHTVDDLADSGIHHIMDWPKSQIAACLFGGNEPPDRLLTTAHELVIIDSEQMFSTDPCDIRETAWWNDRNGSPSESGRRLTLEVCRDLCELSPLDLQEALQIPEGVSVEQPWPIAPKLAASHEYARHFLATYESH